MLPASSAGGVGAEGALSEPDGAVDILAMHAAMSPDKPAVIDQDGTACSYAQLNARVNRCANALLELGLRRGERCLHIHHNRVEGFELGHALRSRQLMGVLTTCSLRRA